MSRTTITTLDRTYTVSPDDPVPSEGRFRALIVGQALDAVTKQPFPARLSVTVMEPGFVVQVKADNWFVVAGDLRSELSKFATQSYTLNFSFSAEGYLSEALAVDIPQAQPGSLPVLVELAATETELQPQP
jgi:hypothetical protein